MPLVATVTVDSTTWAALAFVLTVLGAAYTWFAYRRRGPAAGLRGLAWTLIPVAAWLTGTLKLAANIVNDVLAWAARLVFSPSVWLGVIVAGVAAALFFVSGVLRARGIGTREKAPVDGRRAKQVPAAGSATQRPPQKRTKAKKEDPDDMDEIEAILKRHGI
jgi:uncharacterized membrane protein (UPF0136 family)